MSLQGLDLLVPPGFNTFLLNGTNPMANNIGQQTSTTDLLTGYRTSDEYGRAFIRALIQGKKVKQKSDELDMAAIIREVNTPEDIFLREERWILAGGDCLFSEFEQSVPTTVVNHTIPLWVRLSLNYKLMVLGSIVYFVYYFFASLP